MSKNNIESLLNEGIQAARAGDRRVARDVLEQVVEQDQGNEKAWFWLASVVDTDDERRMCLRTVLKINPNNDKARAALEKIEARLTAKSSARPEDEEVAPGVKRQPLRLLLIVGAALLIVVIAFVILLVVSDNSRRAADEAATQAAIANATGTQVQNTLVAQAATETSSAIIATGDALTQTSIALVSPTPSPRGTSARPTLPPTWTPTGLPTATPTRVLLPYPSAATGRIIAWGGSDLRNTGYLPILQYDLTAGSTAGVVTPQQIGRELGESPRYNAAGTRVVYAFYNEQAFDTSLQSVNLDGSQPEIIDSRWIDYIGLVADPAAPAFVGDSDNYVVQLRVTGSDYEQLFLVRTDGVGRLSNVPLSEFRTPDVSPDVARLVTVRMDRSGAQPVTDLVIINLADAIMIPPPTIPNPNAPTLAPTLTLDPTLPTPTPTTPPSVTITPLTTDGMTLIEETPRWSADGTQIYFAAARPDAPENHDIYVIPAAGGEATPLIVSDGDDRYPVPSPDGQWLAFASNRNGVWEMYLLELATTTIYQVTNSPDPDYPSDWVQ